MVTSDTWVGNQAADLDRDHSFAEGSHRRRVVTFRAGFEVVWTVGDGDRLGLPGRFGRGFELSRLPLVPFMQ
ncbi:MAG: hypothetical protein ACXWH0_01575 [Acidimicrobiia bacterium]